MTQGEIVDWERVKDIALSEAASFRDDEAISSSNPITDASAASFQSRVDTLRILDRDLRVKRTELIAARAEAIAELIRFTTSDGSSADQLRSLAKADQELVEGLAPRRKYWKNAVARIQDALGRGDAADGKIDQGAESGAQKLIRSVQKTNASVDLESRQLAFAAQLVEQRLRAKESAVARSLTGTIELARSGLESASTLLSTSLFEINETPVTPFGLLRVVVFITVAWLLSKAVQRGLRRLAARRTAVNQSSLYTLGRISHYVILTLGLIIGLSSIGIDFTKFALLASALGVGIGFGMQALVSNFVAGLIILFEKSLKVGDFVELQSGVTGEVKEINMRATLLTTNDNVDILVPNSEFINKEVTNWTLREAHRRIHVSFGVAYGTNKELVEKAVLEAADAVRWTLKDNQRQNPQVWFVNFGDSSLDFELVVWLKPEAVKRPGAVQAAYLWAIETKLGEYGIEVPFPQRDLHLRSGFDAFLRQRAAEAEAAPAGTGTGG
ncbi:MAG: mechanosensitive ion channel [Gammaproteobacteria bacterium]|nr:mechanosensitive ion channel [Gammaproteobacteria bacterium]